MSLMKVSTGQGRWRQRSSINNIYALVQVTLLFWSNYNTDPLKCWHYLATCPSGGLICWTCRYLLKINISTTTTLWAHAPFFWLLLFIVGHPTRVNLTSLLRANHFQGSKEMFAYTCMHSLVHSLLPSRRLHLCGNNFSLPHPSLATVGRPLIRLYFRLAITRIFAHLWWK